jgi:hypothetical protein
MPAGFEGLAAQNATAAAIAGFLRTRLDNGNVVTPHNAGRDELADPDDQLPGRVSGDR